ncbi:MAG: hypothetical protein QOK21_1581 [Solirubrobacteraceae bacterium]|jgi:hypothetical protein|nr:hypothetical protein [Solirubrobacteraceae bacterium]
MSDDCLDGNGIAGLLAEVTGAELTSAIRHCQSCGDEHAVGNHRAYRSAGVVLRCPGCAAVAATIVERDDALLISWRGVLRVPRVG